MTKQTGLGARLFVDGYDLSGDTQSLGRIGGGPAPIDVTGIDKSAPERIGGRRDGGIDWVSHFNPATDQAHLVLSTLPRTDRIVSYWQGTALGSPAAVCTAKQITYDPTRGADGALTMAVSAQSNSYGLEWGVQATAGRRVDTSATNGSSVDLGAASSFGLQAWLHVFAFTGTSVTVKLQQSSDNGAGDAFADVTGGGFTAATAAGAQRIETARDQAVERYLRVVTTGTFTSADFAVIVTVNPVEVLF